MRYGSFFVAMSLGVVVGAVAVMFMFCLLMF
jgi:gas vesicle protein